MKTITIADACSFLDEWNKLIGFKTPKHHKQIMNFLIDVLNNEPKRGMLNAFRHSGKSTVVGIFAACVLYNKPNTRILILSAESGLASRMVSHIKNILENHPWCSDVLPDVKKEWGSHKITIKRPIGIREPSVICQGISGNITGRGLGNISGICTGSSLRSILRNWERKERESRNSNGNSGNSSGKFWKSRMKG